MKDKTFTLKMTAEQHNLLKLLAKNKNFTMSNYLLELLYKESDRLWSLDDFDLIIAGIGRSDLLDG
jgi:hypothetical protein